MLVRWSVAYHSGQTPSPWPGSLYRLFPSRTLVLLLDAPLAWRVSILYLSSFHGKHGFRSPGPAYHCALASIAPAFWCYCSQWLVGSTFISSSSSLYIKIFKANMRCKCEEHQVVLGEVNWPTLGREQVKTPMLIKAEHGILLIVTLFYI